MVQWCMDYVGKFQIYETTELEAHELSSTISIRLKCLAWLNS